MKTLPAVRHRRARSPRAVGLVAALDACDLVQQRVGRRVDRHRAGGAGQVQERVLADGGRSRRVLARDRRHADLLHEAGEQPARLGGAPRRERQPPGRAPGREHDDRGRPEPRRVQASRCRRCRARREAAAPASAVHAAGRSTRSSSRRRRPRRPRPRLRRRRRARTVVLRHRVRALLVPVPDDGRGLGEAHCAAGPYRDRQRAPRLPRPHLRAEHRGDPHRHQEPRRPSPASRTSGRR